MTHTPSTPARATILGMNGSPTPYPALNEVLCYFVARARELLADNFIGAYLQGSFALGGFDERSDVDFLIAVNHDIPETAVPELNALHAFIHNFPKPWGHRLEGSYFPAPVLRCWTDVPRDPPETPSRPYTWVDPGTGGTSPRVYPLLFLDHGARVLVRSEHDNTRAVRWVTRERAIILMGPNPHDLIDEVSPEALRSEMRETITRLAAKLLHDHSALSTHWMQAFVVVLYCRMLHTIERGVVTSKKSAAQWAFATLDERWRSLIASSANAKPSVSLGPADPQAVAETLAFVKYARQWASNAAMPA